MCESVNTQVKKPIEIMKKNNTTNATTNNAIAIIENKTNSIAKVNNVEKVDKVFTVSSVKQLFIECGVTPKFSDSTHYVGCGTRANTFSVNTHKKSCSIYCSNDVFNLFDTKNFKQCDFVRGGNSVDKTRPNYIGCNSIDDLKSLLKVVLANNEKIALQK